MIDNPHLYIEPFADAGANLISIHVEPDNFDVGATLREICEKGCQCGIVLNPDTPVEAVVPYLAQVELVLVMTVQPGFGGQSFRESCIEKIASLHRLRDDHRSLYRIEVDGGIDLQTGPRCRQVGADTFVAGTAFFKAADREAFRNALTE
jgi:ribulose-phosphate 3-epimerase